MHAGLFSRTDVHLVWLRSGKYIFRQKTPQFWYLTIRGEYITPPDGMKTDLGSIPQMFWRILPKDEFAPAYICHDWLCYKKEIGGVPVRRKYVDYLLGEMIYTLNSGRKPFKRFLIYRGVRLYACWRWLIGQW